MRQNFERLRLGRANSQRISVAPIVNAKTLPPPNSMESATGNSLGIAIKSIPVGQIPSAKIPGAPLPYQPIDAKRSSNLNVPRVAVKPRSKSTERPKPKLSLDSRPIKILSDTEDVLGSRAAADLDRICVPPPGKSAATATNWSNRNDEWNNRNDDSKALSYGESRGIPASPRLSSVHSRRIVMMPVYENKPNSYQNGTAATLQSPNIQRKSVSSANNGPVPGPVWVHKRDSNGEQPTTSNFQHSLLTRSVPSEPITEKLPTQPRRKWSDIERKRQFRIALNFFNKKPERGVELMVAYGFVTPTPAAIAQFLDTQRGLSKQMIGEYLGNLQQPFNMAVLE